MRKQNNNIFKLSIIVSSIFSVVFCIMIINIFKISYAIETGVFSNGYPTADFSTNNDKDEGENEINYLTEALASDATYNNYLDSFSVKDNYLTNNNEIPLYLLMKNLEVPKATETFEVNQSSVETSNDKVINYIISHGYNKTNSTNTIFTKKTYGDVTDNRLKQYITQVALWLYIYENKSSYSTTYCKNTDANYSYCDFIDKTNAVIPAATIRTMISKASEKNDYKYLKYITDLVDEAKEYKGHETPKLGFFGSDFSYSFSNDGKEIYISNLTPNVTAGKSDYMYYAIEIDDPNKYGVYVSDSNGNKLSNTSMLNNSFSVVVPLSDDITTMDLTTIKVNIFGYFIGNDNRIYKVTKSTGTPLDGVNDNLVKRFKQNGDKFDRYSNVILGYVPYEVISTQFTLNNFTKVSKTDATSMEELPGATLEVTNLDDETKKWSWNSTDKPHYIYLDDGKYKLCETLAPDGYELETECVNFEVDNKSIKAVTMKNHKIEVPNTAMSVNKIIYLIGTILLISGIGFVVYYTFHSKKIEQSN